MSGTNPEKFWESVDAYRAKDRVYCTNCKNRVSHWKACRDCGSAGHIPINRAREKAEKRWHRDMKALFNSAAILALAYAGAAKAGEPMSISDVDALCRTVYAEAAGEPLLGKAAVIDVTLNRVAAKSFGKTIQDVINQRNAFEPVTKSHGWQHLPPLSNEDLTRCETLILLTLEGVDVDKGLPDVTGGATYFQNEEIVADRARKHKVAASLVGFNGKPKTAVIGKHTFYKDGDSPIRESGQTIETPDTTKLYSLSVGDGDPDDLATDNGT